MDRGQYELGRAQAQNLRFKLTDLVDSQDSAGQALIDHALSIENDFESDKNPRSIEDNVKRLMSTLDSLTNIATIIDSRHASSLFEEYQKLQMSIRQFENY